MRLPDQVQKFPTWGNLCTRSPRSLFLTLYTPFQCTLPHTFTYRACPFSVHCLSFNALPAKIRTRNHGMGKILHLFPAASNLSLSTTTGPDKVAYPMLKHLPRSGMNFLLHIFNLSWSSHSFPSIWKTFFIFPIHKMEKPLDSPASFRSISFTSCVSKLFERIIHPVYSSFWNLIPFSLPAMPV